MFALFIFFFLWPKPNSLLIHSTINYEQSWDSILSVTRRYMPRERKDEEGVLDVASQDVARLGKDQMTDVQSLLVQCWPAAGM
jgi:hypothetical protein